MIDVKCLFVNPNGDVTYTVGCQDPEFSEEE